MPNSERKSSLHQISEESTNSSVENLPSSPREIDGKDPSPKDEFFDKDTIKLASKSFGYIQRSIELLGKESTRLAGARDFSNTLHWTQAMKFLKERGFIYTKTGHGTSVAEQFGTLEGLEKAFQEQFSLENFPLPRLSKTHLEKVDAKHFFDESNFRSNSDYGAHFQSRPQFPPYNNFVYSNYVNEKKSTQKQHLSGCYMNNNPFPQVPIPQYATNLSSRRCSTSDIRTSFASGLQALTVAAQSELPSIRRSSAPDCPLPSMNNNVYMKPPAVEKSQHNASDITTPLPSFSKIASQIPEDKLKPKSSNIHSILHIPIPLQPVESIQSSVGEPLFRQKAVDALLLQNFCDHVRSVDDLPSGSSTKRAFTLPSMSDFSANIPAQKDKKQRVEQQPTWNYTTPVVSL
jgi:hypothetical protein